MESEEIYHLIALLEPSSTPNLDISPAILNNLVYYVPRIRSNAMLTDLVNAFFQSNRWVHTDPLILLEVGQSVFQWKLKISEPIIPLSEFFGIWDDCFQRCTNWTLPKLSILCGILSVRSSFNELQNRFYVDESGKVGKLLINWRSTYFMPLWIQLFNQSIYKDAKLTDVLIILYSLVSDDKDVQNNNMAPQWNIISQSSVKVIMRYIEEHDESETSFLAKNVNKIAKVIQCSLLKSSDQCIDRILDDLFIVSRNLSQLEGSSTMPNKYYANEFYSKCYITVVLTLRGCLESRNAIPLEWYYRTLLSLYYLNFIAIDFGTTGFESYEFIQEVSIMGLITTRNTNNLYLKAFGNFKQAIDTTLKYPNKINDSRVLFLLEYLYKINTVSEVLDYPFVQDEILVIETYLNSDYNQLREAAHMAMISLLINPSNSMDFLEWKNRYLLQYITLVTIQFNRDQLTKEQLYIVFKSMRGCCIQLQPLDKDIAKNFLHLIYRTIINTPLNKSANRFELLKGMIYQIPIIDVRYFTNWLDNILALVNQSKLDPDATKEVMDCIWNVLSSTSNDIGLNWWYTNIVPRQSRL